MILHKLICDFALFFCKWTYIILNIDNIQNMFKGFALLGNMTAACMDVSEVQQPALLAAKICGDSIGGIFGVLGNIWYLAVEINLT